MARYGLFCFLGRGHLDPGLAIGRALQWRGHHVTVFHIAIAEAAIRAAGLEFVPLDVHEPADHLLPLPTDRHTRPWRSTIAAIATHAARTLREGPAALRAARIDAVVADQLDIAAGTVAEHLDLPFVNIACAPPVYLDDSVAPPYFAGQHASGERARVRDRKANALVERFARPMLTAINAQRVEWKLPRLERVNDLFSTTGIITQLPEVLELPRATPRHLFYTSQFRDDGIGKPVRFDWNRLDGRPLVYASMGTIRNTSPGIFRTIAGACAPLDVQLVLSLGGGMIGPADLGELPGDPIVVHYAPQRALLERAVLVVNCAGLNTTLDALWNGVPIVAIPVAEDQPGVAARIARAAVGIVEPADTITVERLRAAIVTMLAEPHWRDAARRVQRQLRSINGAERAVDVIERLVSERDPHLRDVRLVNAEAE